MKIMDYPLNEDIQPEDVLLSDGENGTRTIKVEDLAEVSPDFLGEDPAVTHRNIYRGKNLGSEFTQEQLAHIHDGSFEDLYVGDYWDINGTIYRIADINYLWNTSDGSTPNNLAIIADNKNNDWRTKWSDNGSPSSGYQGSTLRSKITTTIKTKIETDFSNATVFTFKYRSTNGINSTANAAVWSNGTDNVISLSFSHIYNIIFPVVRQSGYIIDSAAFSSWRNTQLSIFNLNPTTIQMPDKAYWLSNINTPTVGIIIGPAYVNPDLNGIIYSYEQASYNYDTVYTITPVVARPLFFIG